MYFMPEQFPNAVNLPVLLTVGIKGIGLVCILKVIYPSAVCQDPTLCAFYQTFNYQNLIEDEPHLPEVPEGCGVKSQVEHCSYRALNKTCGRS